MKASLWLILLLSADLVIAQPYDVRVGNSLPADSSESIILFYDSGNPRMLSVFDNTRNREIKGLKIIPKTGRINRKGKVIYLEPADTMNMKITILRKKAVIGEKEFVVRTVPPPRIVFTGKNRRELQHGFHVGLQDTLGFSFVADPLFAMKCPSDLQYTADRITVVRNGNVRNPMPVNGGFRLDQFGLEKGETIKLELNHYLRKNYKGKFIGMDAGYEDFLILKID